MKKWCPGQPVIYIDDSDVVKPGDYKFESPGWVRDGSESTATKNVYKKGYHVTEATVLTHNHHPISIFSEIHSSNEKDVTSINNVTFSVMERGCAMFGKAVFVMDRGYDDNKMFLKLDSMKQDYVLRLTANTILSNNLLEIQKEIDKIKKYILKLNKEEGKEKYEKIFWAGIDDMFTVFYATRVVCIPISGSIQ